MIQGLLVIPYPCSSPKTRWKREVLGRSIPVEAAQGPFPAPPEVPLVPQAVLGKGWAGERVQMWCSR